jgi:hypothetical protein
MYWLRPAMAGLLILLLTPALLPAQPAPADSLHRGEGWGHGAWGPVPAYHDSSSAKFQQRQDPLWETVIELPYQLIKLPFAGLRYGLKQGLVWADETGAIEAVRSMLGPFHLPGGLLVEPEADGVGGLGVGLDIRDETGGDHLRAALRVGLREGGESRLGMRLGNGALRPVLAGGYGYRPDKHFFGLGPRTPDDEAEYSQELGWAALGLEADLPLELSVELLGIYSSLGCLNHDFTNDGGEIAVDAELLSLGARSRGAAVGLRLLRDSTAQTGRPDRGGVQSFKVLRFYEQEEGLGDFWHLRGSLEQFVGLWNSDQTLALRGVLSWIDPMSDEPVAFTRLLATENPDRLRGYAAGRWRDRGLALASAEYRWPLWAHRQTGGLGLDGLLFADAGQVFPYLDELGEDLRMGWGGGLRIVGADGSFGASVEIAFSEEGGRFSLQFEQAFQARKGGIFHGREASILH